MSLGRLLAAMFLSLGAFCPIGSHAVAHAVDSAHARDHDEGMAHEHDGEEPQSPEQHCSDEAPRIADSGTRLLSGPLAQHPILAVETAAVAVAPRLLASALLDPPHLTPQTLAAPSAAGRAPPA